MERERAIFEHQHNLALKARQTDAINLDDASQGDLDQVTEHPAIHPDVKAYARLLCFAREERLAGRVDIALRAEAKLERIYQNIPTKLRW